MKKIILSALATVLLLSAHGQQANTRMGGLRQRLAELNAENDSSLLQKKLKSLTNSDKEEDYILAYSYYSSKSLKEDAETVKKVLLQKFPAGQFAQQEQVRDIEQTKDLTEKDQKFLVIYKKDPSRSFGFLPFNIGKEFAAKGNEEKMKFYADIYANGATDGRGNKIRKESAYATMAIDMIKSNPDVAANYIKFGVEESKASLDRLLAEPNPNANLLLRSKNNHFVMLSSYLYALSNGQESEKAYTLAKEAYDTYKNDPSIDSRIMEPMERAYAHTLVKTKRYKEALPLLEKSILNGQSNEGTMSNLRTAYLAINGANADYATYESSLLSKQKESFKDEVAKLAINEPASDFQLKDFDGNIVKLSDYRGKVVVLDFWATWCGPCKASFPAMQKAVNKYKNDPNVQFLFLHTWEKGGGDPTQSAKQYITDNHYSFKVLMDLRDPKTKASAAASAYKVSGIPAKFIIDRHGKIRFSTSGFSQDADKAVEEMSNMIEFAKKG